MDTFRMYQSKELLKKKVESVDSDSQVSFSLDEHMLEITIKSPNNDQLIVIFSDIRKGNSNESLVDDFFHIIIQKLKTINAGERFIEPLLDFLHSVLVVVILIPEAAVIDQRLTELIRIDFYPNGKVLFDGLNYISFQSAINMV